MTTPLTDEAIAQMWDDLSARGTIEPLDLPRLIHEVETSRATLAAVRATSQSWASTRVPGSPDGFGERSIGSIAGRKQAGSDILDILDGAR